MWIMNAGQKAAKRAAGVGVIASERSTAVLAFLQNTLVSGRIAVSELTIAARAAGLVGDRQSVTTAKIFKSAKKALRIQSVRDGFAGNGQWFWVLPVQAAPVAPSLAPTGQDCDGLAKSQVIYAGGISTLERVPSLQSLQFSAVFDESVEVVDTSVPLSWINGIQHLSYQRAPSGVPLHRWRQFVDDCHAFLASPETWAERAARLGWDCASLFSYSGSGPGGLLWSLAGDKLVELHRDWAIVEGSAGSSRRVVDRRRATLAKMILPWQLR
jgi:hypothetical protein